jgi:aquaporin NIP
MATVARVGAAEAFFIEVVLSFMLVFVIATIATEPASNREASQRRSR